MDFSVVIPIHNAEAWIRLAVGSAVRQSLRPREIILVADACTDQSLELAVQTITRLDPQIAVIPLEVDYRNAALARNAGSDRATCDWIAVQDADDFWYPNHLERAAAVLQHSGDVGLIAHANLFLTEEETIWERPCRWPFTEPANRLSPRDFVYHMVQAPAFTHPSIVLNRRRFVDIGGYDADMVRRHDLEMWLRLIGNGTWAFDPVPSVAFREDTPGSISRQTTSACIYMYLAWRKNESVYQACAPREYQFQIRRTAYNALFALTTHPHRDGALVDRNELWSVLSWKQRLNILLARTFRRAASHWRQNRERRMRERMVESWNRGRKLHDFLEEPI